MMPNSWALEVFYLMKCLPYWSPTTGLKYHRRGHKLVPVFFRG